MVDGNEEGAVLSHGSAASTLRFTDRQLEEEPGRVVADVARALDQEDWF